MQKLRKLPPETIRRQQQQNLTNAKLRHNECPLQSMALTHLTAFSRDLTSFYPRGTKLLQRFRGYFDWVVSGTTFIGWMT